MIIIIMSIIGMIILWEVLNVLFIWGTGKRCEALAFFGLPQSELCGVCPDGGVSYCKRDKIAGLCFRTTVVS